MNFIQETYEFLNTSGIDGLLQLIIAIFTGTITIFEFVKSKNESKTNAAKKKTIMQLGVLASEVDDFNQFYNTFQHQLKSFRDEYVDELCKAIESGKTNDEQTYIEFSIFRKFYNLIGSEIKKNNSICNMYTILLEGEENFSISYGFNRYIDSFRNYMNTPCVKDFNIVCKKIEADVIAINESLENEEYQKNVLVPLQYKFLGLLLMTKGDESILDAPEFSDSYCTIHKRYAKQMYHEYWHLLYDDNFFNSLQSAYNELEPILGEMKIKFKKDPTSSLFDKLVNLPLKIKNNIKVRLLNKRQTSNKTKELLAQLMDINIKARIIQELPTIYQELLNHFRIEYVEEMRKAIYNNIPSAEQNRIEYEIIHRFYKNILNQINLYNFINEAYEKLLDNTEFLSSSNASKTKFDTLRNYMNNPNVKIFNYMCKNISEDEDAINKALSNPEYLENELYPLQYKFLALLLMKHGDESILDVPEFSSPDYTTHKEYAKKLYYDYWYLLDNEAFFFDLEKAYSQLDKF